MNNITSLKMVRKKRTQVILENSIVTVNFKTKVKKKYTQIIQSSK